MTSTIHDSGAVTVARNPEELAEQLTMLSELKVKVMDRVNYRNKRIAYHQKKMQEETAPLDQQIRVLLKAIFAYIRAHKKTMFDNTRTAKFSGGGAISAHLTPNALEVENEDDFISWLLENGHEMAVKTTRTLKKRTLHDNPEIVKAYGKAKFTRQTIYAVKPPRRRPIRLDQRGKRVS